MNPNIYTTLDFFGCVNVQDLFKNRDPFPHEEKLWDDIEKTAAQCDRYCQIFPDKSDVKIEGHNAEARGAAVELAKAAEFYNNAYAKKTGVWAR